MQDLEELIKSGQVVKVWLYGENPPIPPKPGSVKARFGQSVGGELLLAHPDGLCRRDFAQEDIFEMSNRIGELETDGWQIVKSRCDRHNHRQRFTLYSL